MNSLEDVGFQRSVDPEGMIDRINEAPRQIRDAWATVSKFTLPSDFVSVEQLDEVLVLGMGGSAIGADLVAGLVAPAVRVPIWTHRSYRLPGWVDENTLVIASSYSGNTEETLSGWTEAGQRGVPRLAVTTGGQLVSDAGGAPLLSFEYNSQPRAALGHSLTLILGVLWKAGLLPDPAAEIGRASRLLETACREWQPEVPTEENLAKRLAAWFAAGLPVIFGADHLSAVARRWTTQINENSKGWAFWAEMPELNHNVVVGFEHPRGIAEAARVIALLSPSYAERITARFEITGQLMDEAGAAWLPVVAEGQGRLEEMLWTIYLGDFVSYYLAILHNVDPTPVEPIQRLKARLAER
ncbi:MAG TPA: bifunctional phosphoglucose/phosphomannose isomerase [Ardenticatenaceae bacterium]|nr:bifunctional phosphoglucose/phosphomannose isomerase [Ardenticatenaceae bacterium]